MAREKQLSEKKEGTNVQETKDTKTFKRAKRLTVPITSIAHRDVLYCTVMSEMYESDIEGMVKEKQSKPIMVDIVDLETGEMSMLVCNALIQSAFEKLKDGYVKHSFEMRQGGIIEGKKYRSIDIYEIEVKE